jgi:hypothetical protein
VSDETVLGAYEHIGARLVADTQSAAPILSWAANDRANALRNDGAE